MGARKKYLVSLRDTSVNTIYIQFPTSKSPDFRDPSTLFSRKRVHNYKKKKKTHTIVKPMHSFLRSEFKKKRARYESLVFVFAHTHID